MDKDLLNDYVQDLFEFAEDAMNDTDKDIRFGMLQAYKKVFNALERKLIAIDADEPAKYGLNIDFDQKYH